MNNDLKCPYCGELWDRDFLWTWSNLSGGTIETQRRRFRDLGCNAFQDTSEPCGAPAPTPLADFMQAKAKEAKA